MEKKKTKSRSSKTARGSSGGAAQLKRDLDTGTFSSLYILSGEEDWLKKYYLNALKKKIVDSTFAAFNLVEFEGKNLTYEQLSEAVDSYPVMSEKKLIIVTDFDLFKPPAAFAGQLPDVLSHLPDYVCLVFYYDTIAGSPDKRTKLYQSLAKTACFADFPHLEERELVTWIQQQAKALHCEITPRDASYLIFICGNSMTSLTGEIAKTAAHTTTGKIQKENIDAVCSPVLDAVVFHLTDAVTAGQFEQAVSLVGNLLAQRNNEVMIFTALTRQIQRLYAARLCTAARSGREEFMAMVGSQSPYYVEKIRSAAERVPLEWLRRAASLCAKTDALLKSSAADHQKQIELALLQMAADRKEFSA